RRCAQTSRSTTPSCRWRTTNGAPSNRRSRRAPIFTTRSRVERGPRSKRLQVLDQIALLRVRQTELQERVVVLDDVAQRGEAAVVIEAALRTRVEAAQRRRAIALVRRAHRLEVV